MNAHRKIPSKPVRLTMPIEEVMTTQRAIRRLKPDPVDVRCAGTRPLYPGRRKFAV
jgi:hypothetical protein